jgi:hypothetical protein
LAQLRPLLGGSGRGCCVGRPFARSYLASRSVQLSSPNLRVAGRDLMASICFAASLSFCVDESRQHAMQGTKTPYTKGLPTQLVYSLVWNGQFGVRIASVLLLREPLSQDTLPVLDSPGAKRSH